MPHIFRLYQGGSNTYQGWLGSPAYPYNRTARETIENPDGATARNEITSIPSPFARIDLVKNAFREVTESRNLDGDTIFHKLVSDSLDIGEIFFNIDKFKDKVEIITWNAQQSISELMNSMNDGHRCLGDSLQKYIDADGSIYNFDKMHNIYILNYKNGPDALNIIGATSPSTLFFSNANDLSYVSDSLPFGLDKPFDDEYQPLYKRDFEYLKAWFLFRTTTRNFATLFPEVNSYLDATLRAIIDNAKRQELINISEANTKFGVIHVHAAQQLNVVEVLGNNLYKKTIEVEDVESDFQIKAEKTVNGRLLVLPVEKGNKYIDLQYVTDKWGSDNAAPYSDRRGFNERTLPNEGTQMPYITIGDLLEDNIVRVPHALNKECYFDGNADITDTRYSYLLPIKPLFFKFFSPDALMQKMADGNDMIRLQRLSGDSVEVSLRIPIKGKNNVRCVEYSRVYYNNNEPDINNNRGGIKELDFAGLVMPLVKFNNPGDAIYKVACIYDASTKFRLEFGENGESINGIEGRKRVEDDKSMLYAADVYSVENRNFEYIVVIKPGLDICGILVPKFKRQRCHNTFKFSVDLGTSNTHIEYSKNNNNQVEVFKYSKNNGTSCFFERTYDSSVRDYIDLKEENRYLEANILPESVGYDSDFKFPTRTVLMYSKTMNWNNYSCFSEINIPLTYERREQDLTYNECKCNIKWGVGNDARLMEAYIDNLMFMLRNKVLMEDGDLANTDIVWFYPTSMPNNRLTKLHKAWDTSFSRYFNGGHISYMTESFAPILYYFRKYATARTLVNIDIGGGTTDISYARDEVIQFATSFRFASNIMFENAYSELDDNNGIIDYYKEKIKRILSENNKGELVRIFSEENNHRPSNMASFLFSLKDNSMVKDLKSNQIDLNSRLQDDDDFRILFIIFYTAIIYHIAQIIKLKKLDVPRHISFGGNGSKIIKIITTNIDLLAKYTKCVFEEVLGTTYSGKLELLGFEKDSSPKETTCKGGLLDVDGVYDIESIVLKSNGSDLVSSNDTYNKIDEKYKNDAIESVNKFFDFLFKMNGKFNFDTNFGVSKESMKIVKDEYADDIYTYLDNGLKALKDEVNQEDRIEETLFFYPIKGIINNLSNRILETIKLS